MAAVSSAGARNYYHCLRSLYFELYPDVEQERRRPDSRSALPQWPRAMFIGQFGILSPLSFDTTPIALAAGGGHKSQIGWQLWYFQPLLVIKHSLQVYWSSYFRYFISGIKNYTFCFFCTSSCCGFKLKKRIICFWRTPLGKFCGIWSHQLLFSSPRAICCKPRLAKFSHFWLLRITNTRCHCQEDISFLTVVTFVG